MFSVMFMLKRAKQFQNAMPASSIWRGVQMRAMRAALQHFSAFEASAKTFLPPARLKELEVSRPLLTLRI